MTQWSIRCLVSLLCPGTPTVRYLVFVMRHLDINLDFRCLFIQMFYIFHNFIWINNAMPRYFHNIKTLHYSPWTWWTLGRWGRGGGRGARRSCPATGTQSSPWSRTPAFYAHNQNVTTIQRKPLINNLNEGVIGC